MKKISLKLIFLILSILILGIIWLKISQNFQILPETAPSKIEKTTTPSSTSKTPTPSPEIIKLSVNLEVSFSSQAPYAVWDDLHNNACEEAAVLMLDYYLKGQSLSKEIAEKEIQAQVAWEIKNLGGHHDLTASQTAKLLVSQYYGYKNVRVEAVNSVDDIKKELSAGHPVIVPAAGRLLGNPNFRRPGPLYHMLVIRGYNSKQFITNDPGTRKGKNYKYDYNILINAIHDWNQGDVGNGAKRMIII